ncbi:Alcohol dehydrogenase [Desulfovibrio sp. DV]|uniref:iron-containing alcohol dehydrogenase n=1 Tax=Desulfovibrio sp. DV TaxID=1844708 RepID=UPI00094BAEC4|nr:iron-containing alcohol dehydrogenase [Desulfovibrio sp. DV]OLN26497.1 Alcohol dehydrogenase [Desulfovibrio sp. DV]
MGSWQCKIDINRVFTLQPTRPTTFFGIGALARINDILADLAQSGCDAVLIVTDPVAYKASTAWDTVRPALDAHVAWDHYDGVRANPTFANCEAAAKTGRLINAKAVLAIGGGSTLDTAKTAAALLAHPGRKTADFYEKNAAITAALPLIAINTSHGSGSECNAYATAQSDGEDKPIIHSPHLYPAYTIEDPRLTISLPAKHTVATSIDALAHALETATATTASPYSICLAKDAIRTITAFLPTAIRQPGNLTARYWLMYASAIAGISFDLGSLHITHALEHAMSALNADVTHGEGLGILLPAVLREIYPATPEILADLLHPIAPDLTGNPGETDTAVERLKQWFASIGQPASMSVYFTGADVPALTRMAIKSPLSKCLLPQAPIRVDGSVVERIFQNSL